MAIDGMEAMKVGCVLPVLVGVVVAATSTAAFGVLAPCSIPPSVTWSPAHPGPNDVLRFSVNLGSLIAYHTSYVRSAVNVLPANVIQIDALQVEDDVDVPGYQRSVSFGPLAPGDYMVQLIVRFYDPTTGVAQDDCADQPNHSPYISVLTVGATSGVVAKAPVVEFYNATLDHYFMTQNVSEIADLDNGVHVGWQRTGKSFLAYLAGHSDNRGSHVARWYAPTPRIDSHFFSGEGTLEWNHMLVPPLSDVWELETQNAFEIALPDTSTGACPTNTVSVYRVWSNRADSNHRYTTDLAVRDAMVARGYIAEGYGPNGVVMCAPPS
jgi:hypothetical protein